MQNKIFAAFYRGFVFPLISLKKYHLEPTFLLTIPFFNGFRLTLYYAKYVCTYYIPSFQDLRKHNQGYRSQVRYKSNYFFYSFECIKSEIFSITEQFFHTVGKNNFGKKYNYSAE